MSLIQHSLPREALPPGWGPAEDGDERISYRRRRPSITLNAVCVSDDRSHPSLGLGRCWELRYQYSVGECSTSESLCRVPTRQAALDGLLECMHHVHDTVDSPEDPLDVRAALATVSLSARIPERSTSI